jgi:hypothetical protein
VFNWIGRFRDKITLKFDEFFEPYDISCNYKIMITDEVTGAEFSIVDWIKELNNRIEYLEEEKLWTRSEIDRLNQENVELTNCLYEVENRLQAKIDNIHPVTYNLQNYSLDK